MLQSLNPKPYTVSKASLLLDLGFIGFGRLLVVVLRDMKATSSERLSLSL